MREILFRGKRKDNGEWVEGIPIRNKIGIFICYEENPHYCSQYYYMKIQDIAEVIPETVGQYTGLKDKNGTKIFEGNIVQINMIYTHYCCEIFYKNGAWGAKYVSSNREDFEITLAEFYEDSNFYERISVVGNIFDNPELLKGDSEE